MRRSPPWRTAVVLLAALLLAVGSASVAGAAPRARTGGTVQGSVLLPDGVTPAAGVTVRAYELDPPTDDQMACASVSARGSTTTDAAGAYRLTGLPADDDYRIQLLPADPSLAVTWFDDDPLAITVMHGEPVGVVNGQTTSLPAVQLVTGATLRGMVLESGSGTPLGGVEVTLLHQGACQIWPVLSPAVMATPVLTGTDGSFSFTQVPPGEPASGPDDLVTDPGGYATGAEYGSVDLYSWVQDASGWHTGYSDVDAPWPVVTPGATVWHEPFLLTPAGKVSGVVKDARGRGVPGIQLVALHAVLAPWDPSGYEWSHDEADYATALTDSKGRFTMSVTPGITLRLEARDSRLDQGREAPGAWATEYWPASPVPQLAANVVVAPLATKVLPTPFVLERGASMSGIVTEGPEPGVPFGGIHAWALAEVDGEWYRLTATYVYDDGWFGFYGLPAGTYRVEYSVNLDWAPGLVYLEEWPEKPQGQGNPIVLAAGVHRYGIDEWLDPVVLTAKWNGDLGAGVQIVRGDGSGLWGGQYTDPDGHTVVYATASSNGGPYAVQVNWPGGPPEWRWFPQPLTPDQVYEVWLN